MTPNNVKPSYLIINKLNGYIRAHIMNTCLTLVHTDVSKGALKGMNNYKRKSKTLLGQQIITQHRITQKRLELHDTVMIVRSVFHYGNKKYPQTFLDHCLYKLAD